MSGKEDLKFEKRTQMVGFKMTKSDRSKLQVVADGMEVTVSKLVEQVMLDYIKNK